MCIALVLFICLRVLVSRLSVYMFAIVCCKVAFHVTLVCILHVRVDFVTLVSLFVLEFFFFM